MVNRRTKHLILWAIGAITILICAFLILQIQETRRIAAINKESRAIFSEALRVVAYRRMKPWEVDSIREVYEKTCADKAELGLIFAEQLRLEADRITDSLGVVQQEIQDSLRVVAQKRTDSLNVIAQKEMVAEQRNAQKQMVAEQRKWENSKAGRMNKKYPEWSKEDCISLAKGYIWIGMSVDMLKYMWGAPDKVNVSNYGEGNEYQWVWHDRNPSCFYGKADGIITAYN